MSRRGRYQLTDVVRMSIVADRSRPSEGVLFQAFQTLDPVAASKRGNQALGGRMFKRLVRILPGLMAAIGPIAGSAATVLATEAWRADIVEAGAAIRAHHFKPFHSIDEAQWDAAVEDLKRRVPEMSDHRIMVELARLVALINDGHTRLTIPALDRHNLARFSHAEPHPPAHAELYFS